MSGYVIPNVVNRTPRGDRVTDVYSRLLEERIVYLGTELDDGVANALIAQVLHLEAENPELPVNLYINSTGGSPAAVLAVYDTLRFVRAPVATTCVGQAFSSTALLLAAGDPGQRAVLPHARVLLHQPAGQGRGTIPDLILAADEILAVRAELEEALSLHTGQDVATLRRDTDRDRILRADEVVAYGLADTVIRSDVPV
ncbi:ATP-dependent Clp protease protease subunit [Nocardioides zeae]|uniref:ATP-dependent Clp protease protease subunit n=2 Tax=Nocardioides zeae TaxID=1457234 RepID=A0ACC6IHY8_9ACTN|nr:ATP-dependent Clp protease proteolytic subunit [Nocardioides zeae]MDQ1104219.1 ATP-dependent Clp protease protease subunit [Nocardioides zeae]MDR6176092.1 ATP-dependent Clp protease protease subunit [Nocardioides zeae]MDR6210238.1 ATP-dependent Clp protease protease subunit [Nocardioides zeae]